MLRFRVDLITGHVAFGGQMSTSLLIIFSYLRSPPHSKHFTHY
ncbi:protein of unknown function [Shewanella benthica]|uniref:Uncharacterized protein n=1 Tax=Shewanella benthica TaxID=43661 RepID=A0A330M797_9GAMM|nr:protein of unknown function [Shewanella benthica]